jgi:uncharacterized protein YaiI (UPF0178 family)
VIERPENSEIQSITVNDDSLTIKSRGKTYKFEFSELLSDKTAQSPKPVPKNLEEAFKYNGEWCFFNFTPGMLNRLCYLSNPKKSYKVFGKGALLQRVLYKNKYYARDLSKNIYRPDWGIKEDFSPYLIPAKKYLDALNNKIHLTQVEINTIEQKISADLLMLKSEQESYDVFLTANSIIIKKIDKRGNIIIKDSSVKHNSNIQKELRNRYQQIQKREEGLKAANSKMEALKKSLKILQQFRQRLEKVYQKYAVNGSKEAPKKPVKIYL